jgi:hypothetical protein
MAEVISVKVAELKRARHRLAPSVTLPHGGQVGTVLETLAGDVQHAGRLADAPKDLPVARGKPQAHAEPEAISRARPHARPG